MTALRLKVVVASLLILAGGVLYFLFNPVQYTFFPECPFHAFTGWYCPGCGSQRALHALLHGRLIEAAGFNLLTVMLLPFVLYSAVVWTANAFFSTRWKQDIFYKPWFAKCLLLVVLLFAVLRNLPVAALQWLAP